MFTKSKILIISTGLLMLCSAVYGKGVTISNSFGGSEDDLSGKDLFVLGYAADISAGTESFKKSEMYFSDRLQFDVDDDVIEGRVRLDVIDFNARESKSDNETVSVKLKGYGKVNFNGYISFAAGNSFFNTFGVKAGDLYAMDLTPKYAKLLKDGIGFYGTIPFDEDKKYKLNIGTGLECDTDFSEMKKLKLDFGADFIMKKVFSAGITAHNITAGEFGKYGVFLSGKINDFKLNSAFVYNNTDDDVLLCETKYSLSSSVKYENKDSGIALALDVISGLNSEYLAGGKEETLKYYNDASPVTVDFDAAYNINKKLKTGINLLYKDILKAENNKFFQIYPKCSYTSKTGKYSANGGVKFIINQAEGKGLRYITVPFVVKVVLED